MNPTFFTNNFQPLTNIYTNYSPVNLLNKNEKIFIKHIQQVHHRQDNLYHHQNHYNNRNILMSKSPIKVRKQSQTMLLRSDSAKNLQNRRRDSNLCENYSKAVFYQTEKNIKGDAGDLYQTSSTIKDLKAPTLVRKSSFHPKNKPKRSSIFVDKKINGDWFDIIKPIGKGKYGKVFLVRQRQTGFILALKAIQKKKLIQSNLLQQFIRQLKIQFYLNNPGIIKLYGFFDDSQNFYLLMQLGCDGQLYDKIKDKTLLSEQSASFVARTMLEVADYMHKQKVLHRDIKPENIVMILGHLKICDFGWTVYNNNEMRSTFCGTPMYFSPELLSKQQYDQKVDLWAIGVMIFELVVGKSPFNLKQPQDLGRIITHQVEFPKNATLSEQFKDFITSILEKDPQKRPSSEQLLQTSYIKHYESLQICQQLCKKCTNLKKQAEIQRKIKDKILEQI